MQELTKPVSYTHLDVYKRQVYNYLEWLEKAFVIYRCQRYDMQGKTVLKTQETFYLADASLKYLSLIHI